MVVFAVESFVFDVRSPDPTIDDELVRLLEPFAASRTPEHHFVISERRRPFRFEVRLDGTAVHRNDRRRGVVDYILWKASTTAIDEIRDRLVVHAGAVSVGGRGVVLPAPPESGKTTLTAGLVRAGFRYLTDEAVVIDLRSGRLHPFPRALWMDTQSLAAVSRVPGPQPTPAIPALDGGPIHVAPSDIRRSSVGGPCAIRFVIFPTYRPGAPVELTPISRAEAVVALADNGFNVQRFGADGIRALAGVAAASSCFRLTLGDLADAVAAVRRAVTKA